MATVGNTAKPATTQEFFGLNSVNQMAQSITMPAGGPWRITAIGFWAAGVNVAAEMRAVCWSPAGALVQASAPFNVASLPFALGNSVAYEAAMNIQINGGDSVYIGFWRNPAHAVQNGRYGSGSHLHSTVGSSPAGFAGSFSNDSVGAISAWAVYQADNIPPSAPTITTGGLQHNGRTVFYSWAVNDPDGPFMSAHWELWTTDLSQKLDDFSGQAITSMSRTLPAGWNANQEYSYRVRTYDGVWGPWSGFVVVRPNTPPNLPTINSVPTNTLTPTFTGGGSDPDPGNSLTTVQYEVWGGGVLLWTSPQEGGSFSGVTYSGPALSYGTTYSVRSRTRDNWGAWSGWSGFVQWTPVNPVAGAPTLSPNTTATRQTTLTPNLTVSHGSAFTDHEIEINTPSGPVVQSISPAAYAATTSKISVPSALTPGQEYHWRARVLIGGVWSLWSSYAAFKINADPSAPVLSMPDSTISPSGERVVTTLTPRLNAPFNDADKVPYGDAPTASSIEVRNNATDALVQTLTGTADEVTYSGAALAFGTVYKWRRRHTDNAGRQGPFSGYQTFRPTRAPTASLTAPGNTAIVTESTPVIDWAFSSLDGKSQYSYRLTIRDKGPTGANFTDPAPVYDSGEVVSSATEHTVPRGVLLDDHDYEWSVVVKDTDGLTYTLA